MGPSFETRNEIRISSVHASTHGNRSRYGSTCSDSFRSQRPVATNHRRSRQADRTSDLGCSAHGPWANQPNPRSASRLRAPPRRREGTRSAMSVGDARVGVARPRDRRKRLRTTCVLVCSRQRPHGRPGPARLSPLLRSKSMTDWCRAPSYAVASRPIHADLPTRSDPARPGTTRSAARGLASQIRAYLANVLAMAFFDVAWCRAKPLEHLVAPLTWSVRASSTCQEGFLSH